MRVWNFRNLGRTILAGLFWSYLWGFETSLTCSLARSLWPFWSYLWGFETELIAEILNGLLGFGVTYEGLKHRDVRVSVEWILGFGVTYEGLKPLMAQVQGDARNRFGVTYEGLKLSSVRSAFSAETVVLELPMRVWNSSALEDVIAAVEVLELPMRVWNSTCSKRLFRGSKFWSYLWGFETSIASVNRRNCSRFGVTYEGLKLRSCFYYDQYW